ncbi:hypothetical protein XA68_17893 [Ophiocordyceps unilateralis]|uniref:Uncharacterized protein n=1 Tax=Ophiocordyceps unilateralis TaxID=268505 RepID=A0A2A9P3T7_OPHUN|nr:hypothetical protein XA68_17893 [Ophiocordyceps unilateralis]
MDNDDLSDGWRRKVWRGLAMETGERNSCLYIHGLTACGLHLALGPGRWRLIDKRRGSEKYQERCLKERTTRLRTRLVNEADS